MPMNIAEAGRNADLMYEIQTLLGNLNQFPHLAPTPGEGMEQWLGRIDAENAKQGKFSGNDPAGVRALIAGPKGAKLRALFGAQGQPGAPDAGLRGAAQGGGTNYEQELMNFYRMMNDPNAPELAQARALGVNAGQRATQGRGLRGGLSEAGVLKSGADAYYGGLQNRREAGLRALTSAGNLGLGFSAEGRAREGMQFDQNQSNSINAQRQQNAMLGLGLEAGGQILGAGVDLAKSGLRASANSNPNLGADGIGGRDYYNPQSGQYGSNPSDWANPWS